MKLQASELSLLCFAHELFLVVRLDFTANVRLYFPLLHLKYNATTFPATTDLLWNSVQVWGFIVPNCVTADNTPQSQEV